MFNKNDCWKTKNSVVECKASENVCENFNTWEWEGWPGYDSIIGSAEVLPIVREVCWVRERERERERERYREREIQRERESE